MTARPTPLRTVVLAVLVAALATLLIASALPAGGAQPVRSQAADEPLPRPERPLMVLLRADTAERLHELEQRGIDVTHDVRQAAGGGVEAVAAMTPSQIRRARAQGYEIVDSTRPPTLDQLQRQFKGRVDVDPRRRARHGVARPQDARPRVAVQQGSLTVLRTDWFSNYAGTFLSVEVRSANGPDDEVTVTFNDGTGRVTLELSPFVDADEYLYHRFDNPQPVTRAPRRVTIRSADGTTVRTRTREWVDTDVSGYPRGYEWGFTSSGYVDPVQATQKIEKLVELFPDLAEVIAMPYETNGYRRHAQAGIGSTEGNFVFLTTHAWGHEGGNDYTLHFVDPRSPDASLGVRLDDTDVVVSLATDDTGEITSTAAEVVAAINASEVADVATAYTFRRNPGAGVVEASTQPFSDGLDAPDRIPHEPFTVKAIRIGRHRDGSRTGVLAYSQEHAREWVTPLVALETAERLLRNYDSDRATRRLVNQLDIFIIPTVNPDGASYSMYDDMFQRKNMTNHCDPADSDPLRQGSWGVDVNRNFTIGSRLDGYFGASGDCLSAVYSGPAEASEAEARNERWLTETYSNIEFSMNTHSFGGYFMWSPGAYKVPGRIPLPRPSLGVEDYFFEASEHILDRIKQHRDTVIHPGRTGPVIDVLYSAAGNSADDHYYENEDSADPEIFAWNFEVGADRWTGAEWESPGFFWPDFATEGFDQAMEFSNGTIGMLEVARRFARDDRAPRSRVNVRSGREYPGPVDVVFTTTEPADIHYTLDGSRPTFDSPMLERETLRGDAEALRVTETTVLKWFAVDVAGNVERGYDPDGTGRNYRRVRIRIDP